MDSPLLLVPKKWHKKNVHRLQKVESKNNFRICPPLLIEDCLNVMSGHKYFTSLDLDSGYHQIPLATDSCRYTAFTTPLDKFEYTYFPFELRNAPAHSKI